MAGATIIDGKAVAAGVRGRVAREVSEIVAAGERAPGLATVLVGDDPASELYVRRKREACEEVGIESFHHGLPGDVAESELAELLRTLGADEAVNGILLQLPVPDQIDDDAMTDLIDPLKDVDGLHPENAGLLVHGREGLVACTPSGVMELLRSAGAELDGADAVVIGRSRLVGKPLSALLLAENATVTHCHSHTRDLAAICARADVLVAAAGRPRLVTAEMVGEGAIVIDVGTNRTDDGLVGDVDFDAVLGRAGAITPVPGGVGPMTIAMLLSNTVKAARMQHARVARGGAPREGSARR